jgi:hypothetical protein
VESHFIFAYEARRGPKPDVNEFGPLALKTLRQRMIDAGQSRKFINENVDRLR